MRIFEIAPGEKQPVNFKSLKDFWQNKIEVECSEALAEMRKASSWLYRGSNDYGHIYKGSSHNERKPKDSSKYLSVEWDRMLQQLGFDAVRSNSIFCTSNSSHARSFGKVYCVFPINGFKYTYSPYIRDKMIDDWSDFIDDEKNRIIYDEYRRVSSDFVYYDFRKSSPAELVAGLKKLMPDSKIIQSLTPEFLINPTDFQEKWDFQNTQLSVGINRRSEILISGNYYAISWDLLNDYRDANV